MNWLAVGAYAVFFGLGGSLIALISAKAVKAWREALK